MKKGKTIKVIMILTCLLIGCSPNKETDGSNTNDIQYIENTGSITDTAFVSTLDGGISYMNFENGTKVYACNQLDCTHQVDSDCLAFGDEEKGESSFVYPFLYNDKLYYFDERCEEILLTTSLPDGSEKEVIAEQEIELAGVDVLRVGSKLYYWGKVEEKEITNEGINIDTLSVESEIYEADIETGDIRQLSSFGTHYDSSALDLFYSDGYIYFTHSIQQTSWKDTPYADPQNRLAVFDELSIDEYMKMLDIKGMIGRINIDSGELEQGPVNSSAYDNIIGVTEEKIFLVTENEEELICYDKNWENKTILYPTKMMENASGYTCEFVDGQIIISVYESFEKPGEYYIWEDEQNEFRNLEYNLDYDLGILASSENKLLIARAPLKAFSESDEWDYILADKESFFQGELVYIETNNIYETSDLEGVEVTDPEESEKPEEQSEEPSLTMEEIKETYPDKEILVWAYDNEMEITPGQNRALNSTLADKGYEFVIFFEEVDNLSFEEYIDNMVKGETPPDIICGGLGDAGTLQGTYRSVKKEWLLELDSYLDTEEGKALKDAFPEKIWKTFEVNGSIYGVNGIFPFYTDLVYFVNQELADKYNVSTEELANLKPSELGPVLDVVYQGEKAKDFIAYVYDEDEDFQGYYSQVRDHLNNACNAIVVDNRIKKPEPVNLYTQEDQINYFVSLAQYRENGYLTVDKDQLDSDEEINPTNFFILKGYDDMFGDKAKSEQEYIEMDFPKVSEITVVPFAPGNLFPQVNGIAGVCNYSNNKEVAFKALSAVYSQEDLSNILLYGVEGVDYELIDEKVAIDIDEEKGFDVWFRSLYFGNSFISTAFNEEPKNKKEVISEKINQMFITDTVGTYIELDDITDDIDEINSIISEYEGLFDGEIPNVEDAIQELNSRLEDADFQSLFDEIKQRYISAEE